MVNDGVMIVNSPRSMVARSYVSNNTYCFGFNGKEHEDDITGGDYAFEYRIYDPRWCRWLATDPKMKKYPGLSPYNFAVNNPIFFIDQDGGDKTTYYTIITDQGTATFHVVTKNIVMLKWVYSTAEHNYVAVTTHVEQNITLDLRTNLKPGENQTKKGAEVQGGAISFKLYATQLYNKWGKAADEYFPQGKGSEQAGGFHFVAKGFNGDPGMKSKSPVAVRDITELMAYLSTTKFGPTGGGLEKLGVENAGEIANYVKELVEAPEALEEMRTQEEDRLKIKEADEANEKKYICPTCHKPETKEHVTHEENKRNKAKTGATTKPKQ